MSHLEQIIGLKIDDVVISLNLQLFTVEANIYDKLQLIQSDINDNAQYLNSNVQSVNSSLHEKLNANQNAQIISFNQLSTDQQALNTLVSQLQAQSIYKLNSLSTSINEQKLLSFENFSQISALITNSDAKTGSQFTKLQTDVSFCSKETTLNSQINTLKTQISTMNDKMNAFATQNQVQTQLDAIKTQISGIQVQVSQMPSAQYRCIILSAYYGKMYALGDYVQYMGQNGCVVQV
ncbi:Hypothetical_protein [Hexamita inflata]|uniref:Hypothetical_protein n=1 Tax=Hexamita inflata TaxID=28002 RepID=A0AA86UCB1_9EUKA|nr:Hypothetical protein HINF_LOCUS34231 [Hexamita inflata]